MDGVYWIHGVTGAPHDALAEQIGAALTLRDFERLTGQLTVDDQLLIVQQALVLMEQNYVHLPLKRAMHAADPAQRLRLLRVRLRQEPPLSEIQFHREMTRIFSSVRDLHTNYLLPQPYASFTAFLPFLVEEYFDEARAPRYMVTRVADWVRHSTFVPGVEVLYWNGMPIARAIEQNGERQGGSNPEAAHARGLAALTFRPLVRSLPPDEEWVTVGFRADTPDGPRDLEVRIDWLAFVPQRSLAALNPDLPTPEAAAQASDILVDEINHARKAIFAPDAARAERAVATGAMFAAAPGGKGLETTLPGTLTVREVKTRHGTFGHVRIFNFNVNDADAFVAEFVRLARQLPPEGMILDVRGNGGGLLFAGEQLLQVLTPRRIEPERAQFINTPLNLELCRYAPAQLNLGLWEPSIGQAVETGAQFSSAYPITDEGKANALGQQYQGPVVLITDALCYSTTDMFAAGFQDHGIGPVIGTSGNTGAGGANVWTHGLLVQFLQNAPESPYRPLPGGANLRVSIRRTLRTGERAGTPVEDLGVKPDFIYPMTKDDLLGDNQGLMDFAGHVLSRMPVRALEARATARADGRIDLAVRTRGVRRVDVFADARPLQSADVDDGERRLTVALPAGGARQLELQGYDGPDLVVATRIPLG